MKETPRKIFLTIFSCMLFVGSLNGRGKFEVLSHLKMGDGTKEAKAGEFPSDLKDENENADIHFMPNDNCEYVKDSPKLSNSKYSLKIGEKGAVVGDTAFELFGKNACIELWFKAESIDSYMTLFANGPKTTQQSGYGINIDPAGTIMFRSHGEVDNDIKINGNYVEVGKWHHIAVVFNEDEVMTQLYQDGELISEEYKVPGEFHELWPAFIGAGAKNGHAFFDGMIDEFRVITWSDKNFDPSKHFLRK